MHPHRRFLAALAALAAMLFAQGAFALAACHPAGAAARAQMIVAYHLENAGCHEPAENATLCFAHCQSGEQTLDKHQVKVPQASLYSIPLFARPSQDAFQITRLALRVPSPAVGPPSRILFRSLLI